MSDTPRTDSMEPYSPPYCGDGALLVHVPKTFARQLERELNAAKATIALLEKRLEGYDDEWKYRQEAEDGLRNCGG